MTSTGWKTHIVGELAKPEKNSFVIGPFGSDLVLSDYRSAGVPVVFVRDIKRNRFSWKSEVYVDHEKAEKLKAHSAKPQDIVITKMGLPPGLAAVYPDDIPDGIVTADIIRLRPNTELVDSYFLCELLNSHMAQKQVYERTAGQTRPKLTLVDYKTLKLTFPSLPEQKKIAQILSTWDKAITTTEQLLANSQQQKKALMQQLLTGKKRLLDRNGERFKEEWKMVKISSVCDVRRGASPRPIKDPQWFASEGRGWIRISDVTASPTKELLNTTQYLSSAGADNSVCVDPGDLIMSICGTIGVPKFIGIPACIHDGFVVFRECQKNLDLSFLYHYLGFLTEKLASGGQPGTQKNLNTGIVGNTLMPWVSKAEQQKIAAVLSTADQEITTLQQQLDHLKQEKKALMQQLLTGKRRVKVQ